MTKSVGRRTHQGAVSILCFVTFLVQEESDLANCKVLESILLGSMSGHAHELRRTCLEGSTPFPRGAPYAVSVKCAVRNVTIMTKAQQRSMRAQGGKRGCGGKT